MIHASNVRLGEGFQETLSGEVELALEVVCIAVPVETEIIRYTPGLITKPCQ
jgi:hypothetical protein